MEAVRSLVDRIEVSAGAKRGEIEVTLVGRLAWILALGTDKNTRSDDATGGIISLVAGVRSDFDRTSGHFRRQKLHPFWKRL